MSDLTPEKATALRKPFPKESIGKLPKGGAMLDYVGHAAVTDRLLTVDPQWSWEPLALDDVGLPALDKSGNLWIRLTICGVTRLGVGDGKNAKEAIGDAIRNAAMRFGVALDLWAKENLVEFAQAANAGSLTTSAPAEQPAEQPTRRMSRAKPKAVEAEKPGDVDGGDPMSAKTRGHLFALFTELGVTDRDEQLKGINGVIGRTIASRSELTEAEGRDVVLSLEAWKAQRAAEDAS
jgi:hypothetical protein